MVVLPLLLSAAAAAAPPAYSPVYTPHVPAHLPVCRRIRNSDSRTRSGIVCMTAARWERLADESRAFIEAVREPRPVNAAPRRLNY